MDDYQPDSVHLVGSVGLASVDDVFHVCGRTLGSRLRRIPDGEPGGRRMWIAWQQPLLRANPYFTLADKEKGNNSQMKLADGVDAADVHYDELGYAIEARTSYQDFLAARARGDVVPGVRFQVSLPTPYAVVQGRFTPEALPVAWRAYTQAMIAEVGRLCAHISHEDLSIQWDVCLEMVIWDGGGKFRWNLPGDGRTEIIAHLATMAECVPDDVNLGFHLCYGDIDAKHFFDPKDTGALVEMMNAVTAAVSRPIQYFHFPVPQARKDEGYFAPLEGLELKPGTEIFVGLIHGSDTTDETRQRIAVAHRYLPKFGVATECGIARARKPDLVEKLIRRQAEVTVEPKRQRPILR
jgi:hypothetical protein